MCQTSCNTLLFEHYLQELKRISWRIQYKERAKKKKEVSFGENYGFITIDFTPNLLNKVYIYNLLNKLSSEIGRKVIIGIYFEGKTQRELGEELGISQQGVNKWKKKMLTELSLMLNSKD